MDYSKIKLIIWDLDETLWEGTLSDEAVSMPESNVNLIINAVNNGVMCSICSKNDESKVYKELDKYGIRELFVFCSINWSPKGKRVKQIVSEMNLRQPNVLFIDDNATNRGEVVYSCPDINVADVDVINELICYFEKHNSKDLAHDRLNQYRVLETKVDFRAHFADNESFLLDSEIDVSIKHDCSDHIERIEDLVQRSNQLNFTKNRASTDGLLELIKTDGVESGYVEVKDKFGNYGIVGFYAVKDHNLVQFTFSCRTLGMGIEQYVYKKLNYPHITIVGDVSSDLMSPDPVWINATAEHEQEQEKKKQLKKNIVIKGPCDMQQMFAYIAENRNIKTEFVYVGSNGVSIEQGNHTSMILQSQTLGEDKKRILETKYPFSDKDMFATTIFDDGVEYVVLSLFTDPNLGLYIDKETGAYIAFGEYTNDLTDKRNWSRFINKTLFTANCNLNEGNLRFIADNLQYVGRIEPESLCENVKNIFYRLSKNTHLILVVGSEIAYELNKKSAYADRHIYHKKINSLIRELVSTNSRIHLIDVNEFVQGQEDFVDNINHFQRKVYYKMSLKLSEIVEETSGKKLKSNGEVVAKIAAFSEKLKKLLRKVDSHFN